jgi:hypothetical protein
MPLEKNNKYPSDEIAVLRGFEGTETKDVTSWARKYSSAFATRSVFGLNQHYPELQSGYYLNKALVRLIQESLALLGLFVVIEDNYRNDGVVPTEVMGSLEFSDDYLLVDDDLRICGRLRIWESLGGRGRFYHDKVLVEVLTESKLADDLVLQIQEQCRIREIMLNEATVQNK